MLGGERNVNELSRVYGNGFEVGEFDSKMLQNQCCLVVLIFLSTHNLIHYLSDSSVVRYFFGMSYK